MSSCYIVTLLHDDLTWLQLGQVTIGLRLHLQKISQWLHGKSDLHEPHCLVSDLFPYEHLHWLYRLYVVHVKQNIWQCAVPEEVCNLMHSLICMTHDNWDGTLKAIEELGGKAGKDVIIWIIDD